MEEERKLSEDLKIDKFDLDTEAEMHAASYDYWSQRLADARSEKDDADDRVTLIMSEVELEIRKNPPQDLKVTEQVIKSLVLADKRVQEYKKELREIKEDVYHLDAAVKAMEHRKGKISDLVDLYVSGYFSKPEGRRRGVNRQVGDEIRRNLNRRGE